MSEKTYVCDCGADLTKSESVIRWYPYHGHYIKEGRYAGCFEDESAPDNYKDTCSKCDKEL